MSENETLMKLTLTSEITIELIDSMGSDLSILHAARVSTRGGMRFDDLAKSVDQKEITGLINYLVKHRHGTPFEHGAVTMYVHAPIFVWREWHRHRIGWSYNEESARYKTLDPVFYIPPKNRPMVKVDNWKPGRPKFNTLEQEIEDKVYSHEIDSKVDTKYETLKDRLHESYNLAYLYYLQNLEEGFDPGLARDCLPVGIYSSCWVTCNPRSIMAFLSLRTHSPAAKFVSYPLYEIEQAALKIEEIFKRLWPITHQAFCDNGRVGP